MVLITHYDIRTFYRCQMQFYLDNYGDETKRNFHPVIEKRKSHHKKRNITVEDINKSFDYANKLMSEGRNHVRNIWLKYNHFATFVNKIVKISNENAHAKSYYVPVLQRSSYSLKKPLLMEAAFCAFVLGKIQNVDIDFFVLEIRRESYDIKLENHKELLLNNLEEIISCKEGELIPTPSLTRDCKLCEWLNYCTESTKEHGDLSIISGIGEIIKEELSKLGICSIYDLANQDPNLLELDSATKEEVHYFVLQAQSFVDKKPIFRDSHRFKEREYELFVDVEGSPHHDFIWIIGCLVRNGEEIKFHPFVAKEPKDEERMFLDFLDFIDNLPHSFTLYHWSHTEPHYFRKLRDKYILPSNSIDHLLRNTEDIFEIFKKKIILPVHSYTLKNVANAIGFTWHDPLMDGATSILLYDQWRKKNDVHALEKAISYNSDDCKALLIVKDYVDKMIAKTNS